MREDARAVRYQPRAMLSYCSIAPDVLAQYDVRLPQESRGEVCALQLHRT